MGILSHAVLTEINLERPADIPSYDYEKEISSPGDWVKEDQIHVYDSYIVLDIQNATWARFTDTNSMDPLIDDTSNGIELVPSSEDDIQIGDIIAYESEHSSGTIIHRVVEKSSDDKGVYFIAKGDNNDNPDPGKIRFNQIKRVLIGVIY
jgi:signal peptidase I